VTTHYHAITFGVLISRQDSDQTSSIWPGGRDLTFPKIRGLSHLPKGQHILANSRPSPIKGADFQVCPLPPNHFKTLPGAGAIIVADQARDETKEPLVGGENKQSSDGDLLGKIPHGPIWRSTGTRSTIWPAHNLWHNRFVCRVHHGQGHFQPADDVRRCVARAVMDNGAKKSGAIATFER